jgi:putative glutamine amidotransferase
MTHRSVDPDEFVGPEKDAPLPADAPVIAVVVSLTFPQMGQESHELMTRFTRVAFDALRHAGARPVLVDSAATELTDPQSVIDDHDGILFLGGGDVDAALYGVDHPVPNSYGTDRRADDYCLDVMRRAVEADVTVFAICRGSQLLNVMSGGTLIPDLQPFDLHRGGPGRPTFLDEQVSLVPGSRISQILGRSRITVRSGHHQAVNVLGEGLQATAIAEDGVIEGTERVDRRWVVGLQWHPEDSDGSAEDRAMIFDAFVSQCALARSAALPR